MARGIVQGKENNELTVMKGARTELNCQMVEDRGDYVDTSVGDFQALLYTEGTRSTLEDTLDIENEVLVIDADNLSAAVGATRYLYLRYRSPNTAPTWDIDADQYAHLKMNDMEFDTVVTDEKDGTWTASANTILLSTTGKINEAFAFASSRHIEGPAIEAEFQVPFSVAFWAQPTDGQPTTVEAICGKRIDGSTMGVEITVETSGKIRVYLADGTSTVYGMTNVAAFPDGATTWKHIVVTVSTSQIDIWVDGVQQTLDATDDGDIAGAGVDMSTYADTDPFYLGCSSDAGVQERFYNGDLDDFRIVTRVLTSDEIAGLYDSGNGTEDSTDGAEGYTIIGTDPCVLTIK